MLGAVSRRLQIADEVWKQAIEKMVPKKALEINLNAFSMGRSL
jgi:indolepyruvate ferredoxin oxidoreductase beta subunit